MNDSGVLQNRCHSGLNVLINGNYPGTTIQETAVTSTQREE